MSALSTCPNEPPASPVRLAGRSAPPLRVSRRGGGNSYVCPYPQQSPTRTSVARCSVGGFVWLLPYGVQSRWEARVGHGASAPVCAACLEARTVCLRPPKVRLNRNAARCWSPHRSRPPGSSNAGKQCPVAVQGKKCARMMSSPAWARYYTGQYRYARVAKQRHNAADKMRMECHYARSSQTPGLTILRVVMRPSRPPGTPHCPRPVPPPCRHKPARHPRRRRRAQQDRHCVVALVGNVQKEDAHMSAAARRPNQVRPFALEIMSVGVRAL